MVLTGAALEMDEDAIDLGHDVTRAKVDASDQSIAVDAGTSDAECLLRRQRRLDNSTLGTSSTPVRNA